MPQKKWSPVSISIQGLIIIGLVFILMGCFKKPAETISVDKAQATEKEMAAQKQSAALRTSEQAAAEKKAKAARYAVQKGALKTSYVVKKGDSLWWIAKYKDVYNDPYLWPILYDANNKALKNPNKIYPGMKLQIPRAGYKPADIQNARKKAGARKPYNPPARAVPPVD